MKAFFERLPLERCGFLTLTFVDAVSAKEASKRFASFRTNVLGDCFPTWLGVVERSSKSRLHYHLVVETKHDIRTGFDWDAFTGAMELAKRGDYGPEHRRLTKAYAKTAPEALRHLWSLLRKKAPGHGFGRCELLPIRRSGEAVSVYIGKYVAKHMGQRRLDDKGCKTVLARGTARKVSTTFAWNSEGARRWRAAVKSLAAQCRIPSHEMLVHIYGRRWAAGLAATIMHESDRLATLEADKMA